MISLTLEWLKALYVTFLTFYYFNEHSVSHNKLFIIFMIAITFSIIIGIVQLLLLRITKDLSKNMIIARQMHHVVQEPYDPHLRYNVFNDWVSQVYNSTNLQVIEQNRSLQKVTAQIIRYRYFKNDILLNILSRIADLVIVGNAIWLIVYYAQGHIEEKFQNYILIYIVIEACANWRMLTILLMIAILPLVLILICLSCCFCKPRQPSGVDISRILKPIVYENTSQFQHAKQCLICFGEFKENENQKICILQCPGKHVFHEVCIKTWFQNQITCPTCRHNLHQNS